MSNTKKLNTKVLNTDMLHTDMLNTDMLHTDMLHTDMLNTDMLNTQGEDLDDAFKERVRQCVEEMPKTFTDTQVRYQREGVGATKSTVFFRYKCEEIMGGDAGWSAWRESQWNADDTACFKALLWDMSVCDGLKEMTALSTRAYEVIAEAITITRILGYYPPARASLLKRVFQCYRRVWADENIKAKDKEADFANSVGHYVRLLREEFKVRFLTPFVAQSAWHAKIYDETECPHFILDEDVYSECVITLAHRVYQGGWNVV